MYVTYVNIHRNEISIYSDIDLKNCDFAKPQFIHLLFVVIKLAGGFISMFPKASVFRS